MIAVLLNALGLLASLVLSFISSGMETAIYRASRVRMRIRSDNGEARAIGVLRLLERLDNLVTTILIDNNIAAYTATFFLSTQLAIWRAPHAELITTAVITPLFFVLTESLPKQLAYNNADAWSLALVRVFDVMRKLFAPAVWIPNKMSRFLRAALGARGDANIAPSQRAMLLEHLNAGVAENVLSEEQTRMATRIMELEGISAADAMIPLRRMTLVPEGATRRKALAEMTRHGSQLALLVDRAGRVNGQVVTLNSLIMKKGNPDEGLSDATERLERIRAGVAIPEVLNLFRSRYARHALVMERSRAVGLITTKSVLDRIAGLA